MAEAAAKNMKQQVKEYLQKNVTADLTKGDLSTIDCLATPAGGCDRF